MHIWVDADACPNVIKDILFRAAERTRVPVTLVLEKGALALNPRGELYTADTIAQRLTMRNFMDELRGSGVDTGGPAGFHARDRQAFGNALDRWLANQPRPPSPARDTA
ncbi:MAG: DUF188 domain-containing protein [Pseudomonadota bacterium]